MYCTFMEEKRKTSKTKVDSRKSNVYILKNKDMKRFAHM